MSHKVNLGRKLSDMLGMPQAHTPNDVDYPHLHIDDHEDTSLLDMPDEGEAKIKYRVKHRDQSERDDGKGKKKRKCSMTLEVHHIEPPDKPPKKHNHNDEARSSAKNYFDNLK